MGRLLRTLTLNWRLKLLAFALAVLLWVVVSAEQFATDWIPVPLEVESADPRYRLRAGSVPAEVEVRFSGPGRELWDLAIRRPPLVLRLSDVGDTLQTFELEPGMVSVPSHLSVTPQGVRPSRVNLRFERQAVRRLPVSVQVTRGPASGLTLVDSIRVQPAQVEVSGPAERVEALTRIHTIPIDLPDQTASFDRRVPLELVPLRGLRTNAARVRVTGRVERVVERSLPGVRVSVGPGVTIRPTEVEVTLRGPETRVRSVNPADLRVAMAIDSIPARLPPEGILVPLRLDRVPSGVEGTVTPGTLRLLPTRLPQDTVPAAGRAADPDSAGVAGEAR